LFTGKRQQAFWFWFVGLGIIIPTVTYISATLLAFLLGLVLNQIGILSELYVKPMISAILVVCAAFSLFGYYRLWIMYKQKKGSKFHAT
jgi:hypothetical protein